VKFLIDCPPSYGRQNRRFKYKHRLSDQYKLYKDACAEAVAGCEAPEGPLMAFVTCYWDPKHVGDVDACVKATLDGFTQGGLWADDSQVVCLVATQAHAPKDRYPHVEATVVAAEVVLGVDKFTDMLLEAQDLWKERNR